MKVIFAGGGTGGHLYPAVAISEQLVKANIDFYFMVSNRGIEKSILTPLAMQFVAKVCLKLCIVIPLK